MGKWCIFSERKTIPVKKVHRLSLNAANGNTTMIYLITCTRHSPYEAKAASLTKIRITDVVHYLIYRLIDPSFVKLDGSSDTVDAKYRQTIVKIAR